MLFFAILRFVAIFTLFGRLWAIKVFLCKNSVSRARSALLYSIYRRFYWNNFANLQLCSKTTIWCEYSKYMSDNFFGYQVLPPCSVVKVLHCFPLLRFRTTPLQLRRQGLFKRKDSTRERRCKPLKGQLLCLLCHHHFFHSFVFRTYLLMLRMYVMITQRLLKAKKSHIYKIFVIHLP